MCVDGIDTEWHVVCSAPACDVVRVRVGKDEIDLSRGAANVRRQRARVHVECVDAHAYRDASTAHVLYGATTVHTDADPKAPPQKRTYDVPVHGLRRVGHAARLVLVTANRPPVMLCNVGFAETERYFIVFAGHGGIFTKAARVEYQGWIPPST